MSGNFHHQPFGSRADRGSQASVLRQALVSIRPERPAAAFDLDSTLLMNKVRQARIVREYGEQHGDARLARCAPDFVVSWDLRDTAKLCGLTPDEAEQAYAAMKDFWRDRFFTSEYCQDDTPVAGAREFLDAVARKGGEILYITGRHQEMGPGTVESFRRAGFPLPDQKRVQLWLKPQPADDDDRWKEICHARLQELSGLACAFDNEPTHVNAYKRAFPQAVVVHLDTDHSRRPVEVLADIPSIHDFVMTP
jgi:HAD superfamily, subfamily IIIB (Acid phosphatase)